MKNQTVIDEQLTYLKALYETVAKYIWLDDTPNLLPQGLLIAEENYHYQHLEGILLAGQEILSEELYIGFLFDLSALAGLLDEHQQSRSPMLSPLRALTGQAQLVRLCDDLLHRLDPLQLLQLNDKQTKQQYFNLYCGYLSQIEKDSFYQIVSLLHQDQSVENETKDYSTELGFWSKFRSRFAKTAMTCLSLLAIMQRMPMVKASSAYPSPNCSSLEMKYDNFSLSAEVQPILACYSAMTGKLSPKNIAAFGANAVLATNFWELYPRTPFAHEMQERLSKLYKTKEAGKLLPPHSQAAAKHSMYFQATYPAVRIKPKSPSLTLDDILENLNLLDLTNDADAFSRLYKEGGSDEKAKFWLDSIASAMPVDDFDRIHTLRMAFISMVSAFTESDSNAYASYLKKLIRAYEHGFNIQIIFNGNSIYWVGLRLQINPVYPANPFIVRDRLLLAKREGVNSLLLTISEQFDQLPDHLDDAIYNLAVGRLYECGQALALSPIDISNMGDRALRYAYAMRTSNHEEIVNLFDQAEAAQVLQEVDISFLLFASQCSTTVGTEYARRALKKAIELNLLRPVEGKPGKAAIEVYNPDYLFTKRTYEFFIHELEVMGAFFARDYVDLAKGYLALTKEEQERLPLNLINQLLGTNSFSNQNERTSFQGLNHLLQLDVCLANRFWNNFNELVNARVIATLTPNNHNLVTITSDLKDERRITIIAQAELRILHYLWMTQTISAAEIYTRIDTFVTTLEAMVNRERERLQKEIRTWLTKNPYISFEYLIAVENLRIINQHYQWLQEDIVRLKQAVAENNTNNLLPAMYRSSAVTELLNKTSYDYPDILNWQELVKPVLEKAGIDTNKLYKANSITTKVNINTENDMSWGELLYLGGFAGIVGVMVTYLIYRLIKSKPNKPKPVINRRDLETDLGVVNYPEIDRLKLKLAQEFSGGSIQFRVPNENPPFNIVVLPLTDKAEDEHIKIKFSNLLETPTIELGVVDDAEIIANLIRIRAKLLTALADFRKNLNAAEMRRTQEEAKPLDDAKNSITIAWKGLVGKSYHEKISSLFETVSAAIESLTELDHRKSLVNFALELACTASDVEQQKLLLSEFTSILQNVYGSNIQIKDLPSRLRSAWRQVQDQKAFAPLLEVAATRSIASASGDPLPEGSGEEKDYEWWIAAASAGAAELAYNDMASSSGNPTIESDEQDIKSESDSASNDATHSATGTAGAEQDAASLAKRFTHVINPGSKKGKEYSSVTVKSLGNPNLDFLKQLSLVLLALQNNHTAIPEGVLDLAAQLVLMHAAGATNTQEGKDIRNKQLAHGLFSLNNPREMLKKYKHIQGTQRQYIIHTLLMPNLEQQNPKQEDPQKISSRKKSAKSNNQTDSFLELCILKVLVAHITDPKFPKVFREIYLLAYKMQIIRLKHYLEDTLAIGGKRIKEARNDFAHLEGNNSLSVLAQNNNESAEKALQELAFEDIESKFDSIINQTERTLKGADLSLYSTVADTQLQEAGLLSRFSMSK